MKPDAVSWKNRLAPPLPWPGLVWTWEDVAKSQAGRFAPTRAAERAYARVLRNLAARIGEVLTSHTPQKAEELLREYARSITPWARATAANMLAGVKRDNAAQFRRIAHRMGFDMRALLTGSAIGEAVQRRIQENTRLITSLPFEAAVRAGELAHEGLTTGRRAEDMARELQRISDVTTHRAHCIALTEVSKASTALTQARAASVGSEGYIWRSVRDGATRASHRAMEGRFIPWDAPPTLDGMTGHAGEFPYCRCYPEPVIPKGDDTRKTFAPFLPTRAQEEATGQKRLLTQWEKSLGAEVIPHVPGTPLPNVEKARFLPEKLTAYSMDSEAVLPNGSPNTDARGKAKSFEFWLGMTKEHAADVERQVMAYLPHLPALPKGTDMYGQRFNVYVPVTGPNGKTVDVMTAWIYDRDKERGRYVSTRPRLINCFIDRHIDKEGRYHGTGY